MLPTSAIPGPGRVSLFRTLRTQIAFDRDPLGFMTGLRDRYGKLVRYQSMAGTLLFAFGPEHHRELYSETDLFHSRPFVIRGPRGSAHSRLRESIFYKNGADHHRIRHAMLPAFQRSVLPDYYATIVQLVEQMMHDWRPGSRRDLHRDLHLMVWSIVRKMLYGLEEDAASEELYEALEHWMFQTFNPWVRSFPINLPFTPFRRLLRQAEHLEQTFLTIIRARRAKPGGNLDALSCLLNARRPDGTLMPDAEIVGHVLTLFLVAYETTGNALNWAFFLLSQHPSIQQDLLDELTPWQGNAPPPNVLEALPYLSIVVKESLRILPAVPYSRRLTSREGPLAGYTLPKDTRIVFSHYMTHHLPEVYQQPERFWPDRWLWFKPALGEYVPFGAGVRTCIGSALAQFVIKIALTMVLPRWKINVVSGTVVNRHNGISLSPRGGLPVIIQRQDRQLTASDVKGNIHEMVELGKDTAVTVPLPRAG
jgi:cytochrome P450